jgi:hypothetical protein
MMLILGLVTQNRISLHSRVAFCTSLSNSLIKDCPVSSILAKRCSQNTCRGSCKLLKLWCRTLWLRRARLVEWRLLFRRTGDSASTLLGIWFPITTSLFHPRVKIGRTQPVQIRVEVLHRRTIFVKRLSHRQAGIWETFQMLLEVDQSLVSIIILRKSAESRNHISWPWWKAVQGSQHRPPISPDFFECSDTQKHQNKRKQAALSGKWPPSRNWAYTDLMALTESWAQI